MSNNLNFQPNSVNNLMQVQTPQGYQSLFPAPIGNIYGLTTASEINNIPAGNNISVGLCLQENVMYIKSYQNGTPMLLGYRLAPLEPPKEKAPENESKVLEVLDDLKGRIVKLEQSFVKKPEGGKLQWQV